ncbi:MAG: extracellular solute-binding protein [Acholeplasmataceae bacterium]|nr:extracellular solute-binding protein [Acholeplasmataceae bacterium]
MKKTLLLLFALLLGLSLIGCKRDNRIVVRFVLPSGQIADAIKNLKFEEDFENENPDINVIITGVSGSYDDVKKQTILDINSGSKSAPDLVLGYPDHFAEYYGGGALVNMQPYIDNPEYGFTEDELADFIPSYLAENRGFINNESQDLFGLPFNKSSEVLIYNKTAMVALYGEEEYLNKVPSTWAELETLTADIMAKVTNGDLDNIWEEEADDPDTEEIDPKYLSISRYVTENKFRPFGYDASDNAFITLLHQWGLPYTSRDNVSKGYYEFDTDGTRAMLEELVRLNTAKVFNLAPHFGSNYCSDALKQIRCLLTVGSTAGVRYNESSKYEYELGVAPIPYKEADKKFVIQQGTNIAMLDVNSTEEELIAAWKFVKFMLTPERAAKFAMETGGYFPVRASSFNSDEYQEYLENPTDDKRAYSQAATVAFTSYNVDYTYFVDPAFLGSSEIRDEVEILLEDILVNASDVDASMRNTINKLFPYKKAAAN